LFLKTAKFKTARNNK